MVQNEPSFEKHTTAQLAADQNRTPQKIPKKQKNRKLFGYLFGVYTVKSHKSLKISMRDFEIMKIGFSFTHKTAFFTSIWQVEEQKRHANKRHLYLF